ncbi:MAG: rod shape-determining protein RodA [Bacteroidales bacterium]|nr:rod shape-determining protein RodA [Bacteroidales bacterium]
MTREINIWKRIDKITVVIFLLMIAMGWLNIYAAVYNEENKEILDFSQRYGKQFIWIIATLVLAIFVVIIDTRFWLFFAYFIYAGIMFMLLLVLVVGKEINGARSWFEIAGLSLQPSEFAKFGTALALASFLGSKRVDLRRITVLLQASAIIVFPAVLIALQPDMGSTVVFFSLFIVLFREGMSPYIFISGILMGILFFLTLLVNNLYLELILVFLSSALIWFVTKKWKIAITGIGMFAVVTGILYLINTLLTRSFANETVLLTGLILTGLVFILYIVSRKNSSVLVVYLFLTGSILFINSVDYVFNSLLQSHQKERVEIMLGIKSDPRGTGYNVTQSIISIGSGGFAGKGYLQGTQTKFKFVPAQSTDFIFCTVGEEWGFLGSLVVTGMYLFLLLRLIWLAERQRSAFSRIYGYGVVSVFFIHIIINIGMAVGLVPVIGIPLPFLSYGGSSLWGFTILLFIFLRLDASRTEYLI